MMSDRLPPLTALRAFDAAARHMSFAKAADELSVTPAALSFQIKSLEEHLGAPLFLRLNRAVELTEAGRTLDRVRLQAFKHWPPRGGPHSACRTNRPSRSPQAQLSRQSGWPLGYMNLPKAIPKSN